MARARNIKPGFFKNYELADLGPVAQLLFSGLWCLADKDGRLEDKPRFIKAEIFPYYDVDVNGELTKLERCGFVKRYEASGIKVVVILNFKKHQSPHHTEKPSELPPPPDASVCSAKTRGNHGEVTVSSPCKDGGNPPDSLIPDSLIPDSGSTSPSGDVESASDSATAMLAAYHRILPNCTSVHVLNPKRRKRFREAEKLAKRVCREQGWEYEPAVFWEGYFAVCAGDEWLRGDKPNPNNPAWKQSIDVLLDEDRFARIMDGAITAIKAEATA